MSDQPAKSSTIFDLEVAIPEESDRHMVGVTAAVLNETVTLIVEAGGNLADDAVSLSSLQEFADKCRMFFEEGK